jgi:hypothetical protein
MNQIKSSIKVLAIVLVMMVSVNKVQSQVSIGVPVPSGSAMLDVSSTTKGFLPPRMSEIQRVLIIKPDAGLMVYQTDGKKGLYYYDGSSWTYVLTQFNTLIPNESVIEIGGGINDNISTLGTVAAPKFTTSEWMNVGGFAGRLRTPRKIFGNTNLFDGTADLTSNLVSDGITSAPLTPGAPNRGFLNVAGPSTLTGTLTVGGATSINNTLTVNNATTLSSTLFVAGTSTLSGTVTSKVINNTGVILNRGLLANVGFLYSTFATISSTLAVLGTSTLSGTLTTLNGINNIGTITNTGSLINTGDLTVIGNATISQTLNVPYIKSTNDSSLNLQPQNNDPNSFLKIYTTVESEPEPTTTPTTEIHLEANEGKLKLGNEYTFLEVNSTGNISGVTNIDDGKILISANELTVAANTTITGTTTLGSTLDVTGATTLSNTLAVNGASTLSGTLTTIAGISNTGTITNTGSIVNTGDLTVNGNATITGTLAVGGNTTITGTIKSSSYILNVPTQITATSSTTIDLSTGNIFIIDLASSITDLSLTNAKPGTYMLEFVQSRTNNNGQHTVSFPSGWFWSGSYIPEITKLSLIDNTEVKRIDFITVIFDGINYFAAATQNFGVPPPPVTP